jgi:hypothetical protein
MESQRLREGGRKWGGGGVGASNLYLSACHACQLKLSCLTFICYDLSNASRCIAVCNVHRFGHGLSQNYAILRSFGVSQQGK